jgi:type IX secretion system PorP/SprF family membrane protein
MKLLILFALTVFFFQVCRSQDHQLSPFSSSPLSVNPAATGAFGNSNLRIFTGFDGGSNAQKDRGYLLHLAVDKTLLKGNIGVGADFCYTYWSLFYLYSGWINYLGNTDFMLSAAYHKNLFNDDYKLSAGIQAGFTRNHYNLDGEAAAIIDDPDYKENIFYPDVNIGVIFAGNSQEKFLTPWFGISVNHIFKPDVSHWGLAVPLYRRVTINAGTDIHINKNIFISPLVLYSFQDEYKFLNLGLSATKNYSNSRASLGGLYRRSNYGLNYTNQLNLIFGYGYASFDLRAEILIHTLTSLYHQKYYGGIIGLRYTMPENNR